MRSLASSPGLIPAASDWAKRLTAVIFLKPLLHCSDGEEAMLDKEQGLQRSVADVDCNDD